MLSLPRAWVLGSNPGQGTKIPQATQPKKKKKRKVSYLLKHIVSVNTVIWREGKGTKRKEKGSILLSIIMANMIACKISINKTRQREMLINFIKRPGGLVLYPRSARLALA